MGESTARDFFISYTAVDEPWAKWIAVTLEGAGYTTLVQAYDSQPGSAFLHLMQQATSSDTARTIAVLSEGYFGSKFGEAEWRVAFAKDPTGEQGLLIPVRVQPCEPPGLLADRVYIDLVGVDEVTARQRLLVGVNIAGARPTTAWFPGGPQSPAAASAWFPGSGPEVSNLSRRNPRLTGRDADLERLHADLLASTAARGVPIQAVHGLGGVGKTTLALEYAHRFASDYDLIWWVNAEQPTTATAELALLATRLGVAQAGDQPEMVQGLFDLLRRRGRWLLIYDNAERPDQLADLLPTGGGGHVLVTSRWSAWGSYATAQLLSTLPRAESVQFLCRRTGHTDQASLDALAELVGDLPLALEEAAAYLEETQDDLAHYLGLVRDRARELFGQDEPGVEDETADRQRVATVWSVSLERVHAHAPAAEALLNMCAFLAPDVPRELPTEQSHVLPDELATVVGDPLRYNRTLATIGQYSLATVSPASIGLHRLVQIVVQARLPEADERAWVECAAGLLRESFPNDSWEISTWPRCQRLLPHLLALCEHAQRLQVAGVATGWLLDRASTYLRKRGQYLQARPLAKRALAVTETALGPAAVETAWCRDTLGRVLHELGDLVGARAQLERALQIGEAARGPDHPDVAIWRNNLGRVLQDLGDLVGARAQFERALQIGEAALGPDHPHVATWRSNLGRVLQDLDE